MQFLEQRIYSNVEPFWFHLTCLPIMMMMWSFT